MYNIMMCTEYKMNLGKKTAMQTFKLDAISTTVSKISDLPITQI